MSAGDFPNLMNNCSPLYHHQPCQCHACTLSRPPYAGMRPYIDPQSIDYDLLAEKIVKLLIENQK